MYCSKCGKKIEDNSKFCMYCGDKKNAIYDAQKTGVVKDIIKEKEPITLDKSNQIIDATKPKKKPTNKTAIIITIAIALFVIFILLGIILALLIALFINNSKTDNSFIVSNYEENSSTNNDFGTDFEENEYIENNADNVNNENNENTYTDMVYTYDNGRLSTTVGSADVYYNGEHYNGVATFIPNPSYNTDIFWIKDFYRDLEFCLVSYNDYIMTGDSYTKDELVELADNDKVRLSLDNFPIEYDGWGTISLSSLSSAKYYFDSAVIDIINYDETGVTVIYFYYTFHDDDGNHYEVEALGAAELSEAEIQNSSSGNMDYSISTPSVCSVCHGSGICQVCYGRGGMSYTTWGQGGDGWVECTGCHGDRSCQYCD